MKQGNYKIKDMSITRLMVKDATRIGQKIPYIHTITELDISGLRKKLKHISKESRKEISLNAYVLFCFAKTIVENRAVQAMEGRKNRLIIFDDVDIFFPLECTINQTKTLIPTIIRKANSLSPSIINKQIQTAQNLSKIPFDKSQIFFLKLPIFIKAWFYKYWMKQPIHRKQHFGTAYFSAIGTFGPSKDWGIPIPMQSIGLFLGSIHQKESTLNDHGSNTEILHFTISVDHNIVDGGELGRFLKAFKENVKSIIYTNENW